MFVKCFRMLQMKDAIEVQSFVVVVVLDLESFTSLCRQRSAKQYPTVEFNGWALCAYGIYGSCSRAVCYNGAHICSCFQFWMLGSKTSTRKWVSLWFGATTHAAGRDEELSCNWSHKKAFWLIYPDFHLRLTGNTHDSDAQQGHSFPSEYL